MSNKTKYGSLSKNTLLFTLNSFGTKLISFLLIPLYTSVIQGTEMGSIDLMNTTVSLLIPVLTLNIQDAVLRFALDRSYDNKTVFKNALIVNLFGCIILTVGLLILRQTGILHFEDKYLLFLYFMYILSAAFNSLSMLLKAEDKVFVLVTCGILNTLITCMLNILLLVVVKMGVDGYMIANVTGQLIACLIAFFGGRLYRYVFEKGSFDKKVFIAMIVYSAPLIVNSVAWWINNASDKYIITAFCGTDANGIFSVAYKIPTILSTVQTVFYSAWSISAISEFDKDDKDGFIGNIYTLYSVVSVLTCSGILIFNGVLSTMLYQKEYIIAREYVPFLLTGAMFNGLALFEGCLFTAVKKTKLVSVSTLIGAVINIVLNIILIWKFGPLGAAVATFTGYLSVWIIRTITLKKIVTMKISWIPHFITYILIFVQTVLTVLNLDILGIPIIIVILFIQRKYLSSIIGAVRKKLIKR